MFPFDAILFDVGGVLLTNGWDRAERAAAVAHFGLNAQELDTNHFAVMEPWERGEFVSFMLAQSQPLPNGALPILAELAASNPCASNSCLIGALNNEARATNEYRFS